MKNSIQQKLTKSYLVLLTTVVLVMFIGSVLVLTLSIVPNMRLTMQSSGNELRNRISEQFEYLDRATDTAFLNLNTIDRDLLSEPGGILKYNAINSSLYKMRLVYGDVQHAVFFDNYGNAYADNSLLEASLVAQFDSSLHDLLLAEHGRSMCFGLVEIPCLSADKPLLLMGKMISHMDSLESVGYLYVTASHDLLTELYDEQMICEGQRICLCDERGTVLSSSDPELAGSSLSMHEGGSLARLLVFHQGKLWLYHQEYIDTAGLYAILMVPMMELYSTNGISMLVLAVAALIGLYVSFAESSGISRRILNPLMRLTETVNKVQDGNMDVRCQVSGDDEVALLADSFNSMLQRIELLISQLELKQQETLRTELTVQQNKIQPHFLYNTINGISALCEMKRTEDAARMSNLVAKYYKSVLSDGKDIITVEQELSFVETYFSILLCSRPDYFSYTIDCHEQVKDIPIPKMTLQPLVENSVKHGFERRSGNRIDIRAYPDKGRVVISISDNGRGMDVNNFYQIQQSRDSGHFGIFSVCRRMELLCGEGYSLSAQSRSDMGAEITLSYDTAQILSIAPSPEKKG